MKCILVIAFVMIHNSYGSMEHHGPKGHFDLTKCCNVEKTIGQTEFMEKMIQMAEECKQELGPPESPRPPLRFMCMHECLANKTKTINADKSINENGYRNFVKNQMATQPFQKAAADDIITKCIEELKKPDPAKPDELASGCSKNAMRAFKCAARGLFNSCPADMQDSSEKCTKMREMINSDKMDKFAEGVMEKRDIK